uniref:RPGRIP1-like n=1 Tax=Nothobranchius korthausae TaxID=1143690 RepID=A0A1A8G3P5_9TELE
MSRVLDETAADAPVRDVAIDASRLTAAPPDAFYQHTRTQRNISRVSREELEDQFLRLHEETLQLKQQIHNKDDKIKKLGTKLMRLVKDRGRMEQLVMGGAQPPPRLRDVEMEQMVEELQEKVRVLQAEKEGLKQSLLVAQQQLLSSSNQRPSPYGHAAPRVNSGLRRLRDTSSPSPQRPRSLKSLDEGVRPPTGLLPRYGHSLLEEARAEIRSLEALVDSQRSRMEELEGTLEQQREELRRKDEEYEERLLQARQQHSSSLRFQVNSNTSMIRLQKQLADRSNRVTELEGRYVQLQEAQRTLKVSHDAAMERLDEFSAQLKDERLKNLQLNKQLQMENINKVQMEQLQEQVTELEQERDLLKDNNKKLLNSIFDVSQQQKRQIQEQQLKVQITQLETAQKADLKDKNKILDQLRVEQDKNQQLVEQKKELHVQFLEQKQQVEELKNHLKFYSQENDYSVAELTEALLLIKKRQKSGDLGFLLEVDNEASSSMEAKLRAAHAETIQELEKTRNLLNMESQISRDYKVELEAAVQKMNSNRVEYEKKLAHQAQLLDSRAAKISRLEAQLTDFAYGHKPHIFKPDLITADEMKELGEALDLEHGESLLEIQIVGASLSPHILPVLGDVEPSTFCTYSFYLFGLHSTPVVAGLSPRYGFTSKYVVHLDEYFLDYLSRCAVLVELHQVLGLDWRTLGMCQLPLHQLHQQDRKVQGNIPLVGTHKELQYIGSVDYWIRLTVPETKTTHPNREKLQSVGSLHTRPSPHSQLLQAPSSSWNQLFITVQHCSNLQPRISHSPSPYVVYKFFTFPDYATATVHDSFDPEFNDFQSFSILMDQDLDQYLKSELLQIYVFDYKEKQMDAYLGKAQVPLLPLTHNQEVSGVFDLTAFSGLPAGSIDVTLRWNSSYRPPPGTVDASESLHFVSQRKHVEELTDSEPQQHNIEKETTETSLEVVEMLQMDRTPLYSSRGTKAALAPAKELMSKLRGQSPREDGPAAKRVTFIDATPADTQVESKASQRATEEEGDEEVHVSEGQLVPSTQSDLDDSDISEEIMEDVDEAPAATDCQTALTQSDSDDCIVQRPEAGGKLLERVRVQVVSLSLTPESRLVRDDSVVRLFVEYNFLDLPTQETPMSLPKPPQGRSIYFNYSQVFPVDAERNEARRRLLRAVLLGRKPDMDRIRFMVVSEPPEEEEQEKECEDVGVAYLKIHEMLENQEDLMEASLMGQRTNTHTHTLGRLTVSVEGLDVLRAIMEDHDLE